MMTQHEMETVVLRQRAPEVDGDPAKQDSVGSNGHARVNGHEFDSNTSLMMSALRALLGELEIVVWAIDEQGTFTYHDGRGCEAIGIPRGSLVGKNIFELFPDSTGILRALAGERHHDLSNVGGITWENWYVPVKDHDHERLSVIGLSLNVTEAHRAKVDLEAKFALIERQQTVISDLETPVIQVWDRVVTLPMVGVVDSRRAARVTDDLLKRVAQTQAYFAILDLTGVEVVDTATAGHLLNMISAIRLLGAEGIVTGIRPTIAQTIVSLGVELTSVRTFGTLRDGLAYAIRALADQSGVSDPWKTSNTPGGTKPALRPRNPSR